MNKTTSFNKEALLYRLPLRADGSDSGPASPVLLCAGRQPTVRKTCGFYDVNGSRRTISSPAMVFLWSNQIGASWKACKLMRVCAAFQNSNRSQYIVNGLVI